MDDSYRALYQETFGAEVPDVQRVGASEADVIQPTRGKGFMGAADFTMQVQVGCPGGCRFCYVPSSPCLTPPAVKGPGGSLWGTLVKNKIHAAEKLGRHLDAGGLADKTIYWSGVTDPYAASPETTRAIWQTFISSDLATRPRRIIIQSRFRADRDRGLVAEYCAVRTPSDNGPAVVYSLSIGTDRNDLIRAWERATPNFGQRLRCVELLRSQGLFVVITLSPFALWNDLTGTLQYFRSLGVAYITMLFFKCGTKSANTPAPFLKYLKESLPELLDPAWQFEREAEVVSVFGRNRVLAGQAGFASLTKPHEVIGSGSGAEI